jgi:hypothetical protein
MKAYFGESSVEAQNRLTRSWTRRGEGDEAADTARVRERRKREKEKPAPNSTYC